MVTDPEALRVMLKKAAIMNSPIYFVVIISLAV